MNSFQVVVALSAICQTVLLQNVAPPAPGNFLFTPVQSCATNTRTCDITIVGNTDPNIVQIKFPDGCAFDKAPVLGTHTLVRGEGSEFTQEGEGPIFFLNGRTLGRRNAQCNFNGQLRRQRPGFATRLDPGKYNFKPEQECAGNTRSCQITILPPRDSTMRIMFPPGGCIFDKAPVLGIHVLERRLGRLFKQEGDRNSFFLRGRNFGRTNGTCNFNWDLIRSAQQ